MTKSLQKWLRPFAITAPDVEIGHLRADSREVQPSDLFIAVQGVEQNGVAFITDAINRGAAAILVDAADAGQVNTEAVAVIAVEQLASKLPKLLAAFYCHAAKLKTVGVTGTNGKTTTTQLVAQLVECVGGKAAVIGTMGTGSVNDLQPNPNTTPGLVNNFRLLDEFGRQGVDVVAMEVSSQGISQGRVDGIAFDAVVFTNLTQDHLDYHGDLASYAAAKKQLFERNPQSATVVNVDDPVGAEWANEWRGKRRLTVVGQYNEEFAKVMHFMFDDSQCVAGGLSFHLKSHFGDEKLLCPLYGDFNVNNLVCAMAALKACGYSLSDLTQSLDQLKAVGGRMEQFCSRHNQVMAVVDYAHTPDALQQALRALKPHTEGELWCVFGCGGDRDKGKRPQMGRIAGQYADRVVLTNDNPRNEAPEQIIKDIQAGLSSATGSMVELDRKRAIANTLAHARRGDVVTYCR